MLPLLDSYARFWEKMPYSSEKKLSKETENILEKFYAFSSSAGNLFCRSHTPGHFTGSAFVVNDSFDQVLLTLHAKLDAWLHLGGHADGESDIASVALREAREESGLETFEFVDLPKIFSLPNFEKKMVPFDIGYHLIPSSKCEPEHFHYDVSFLLMADERAPLCITPESKALRWFDLQEAMEITPDLTMHRMFAKLRAILNILRA